MRLSILALALVLAACGQLPRDPGGTLDHVTRDHRFRVGIVPDIAADRPEVRALLARLGRQTAAAPAIERASLEPMLNRLEHGGLDIVIAHLAHDTPWIDKVALGPPLAISGADDARIDLRPAMRNGENAWIMRVEQAVRAVAPQAARR